PDPARIGRKSARERPQDAIPTGAVRTHAPAQAPQSLLPHTDRPGTAHDLEKILEILIGGAGRTWGDFFVKDRRSRSFSAGHSTTHAGIPRRELALLSLDC